MAGFDGTFTRYVVIGIKSIYGFVPFSPIENGLPLLLLMIMVMKMEDQAILSCVKINGN